MMRDLLDQLATQRDLLATLHATVQRQGTELARSRQRRQRGRAAWRSLPLLLAGLLVALLPLSLLAANPTFSDLNDAAEVHRPNIQAIGNAGITTGFEDPNNPNARLYNPKGLVTREEMASFLARTAGLGSNAPVVNAATSVNATTAQNAATLGGIAPSGFARAAQATGASNTALTGIVPTSWQAVAQVRLDSPAPGFILVSGAVGFETTDPDCGSADFNACLLYIRLRDTVAPIGPDPATPRSASPSRFAMARYDGDRVPAVTQSYLFPVEAGQRTFVIEVATITTYINKVRVREPILTALYVPFGFDGGTTLSPMP
jgi:hypothetical protein